MLLKVSVYVEICHFHNEHSKYLILMHSNSRKVCVFLEVSSISSVYQVSEPRLKEYRFMKFNLTFL